MYAEDAHKTIAYKDITELISMTKKELLYIGNWMRVNKQSGNTKNTEFIVIGHQC